MIKFILSGVAFVVILIILTSGTAHAMSCPVLERNLRIGNTGEDVRALQVFLNSSAATVIADSGAGSPRQESISYGPRTAAAVLRFQEIHASSILSPLGLTHGTGMLGKKTREHIASLCATINRDSPTMSDIQTLPGVADLIISKPDQPIATLAPAGAGGVEFTTFTLTADTKDVRVTSILIERTGPGADGAIDSVGIHDDSGELVTDEKTLSTSHRALFNTELIIPAGTSQTLTIYANMSDDVVDFAGQMPSLSVIEVHADASVKGSLPLTGTAHIVNETIIIGSVLAMRSSNDPGSDITRYIDDRAIIFAAIRMTAVGEDVILSSITWDQAGTAGSNDIENVTTEVEGKPYPAVQNGRTFVSNFEPSLLIEKGRSADVLVRGDLRPGAANRTVKFDVRESGDIGTDGAEFGFGVGVSPMSHTDILGNSVFITTDGNPDGDEGIPFYSGALVTVRGGTVNSVGRQ